MAYFLGRDVDVYITTESASGASNVGVWISGGAESTLVNTSGSGDIHFAFARNHTDYLTYAVKDVTGLDLSIGAVDEDITYFGVRSVTKAEVKKETTVSLTAKKSNFGWDEIFDSGRYGTTTGGSFTGNALRSPTVDTGYRLHVVLKSGEEVFTVPGMCVQGHTVSVNADGTSEETLEFMSYVTPLIGNAANTGAISGSAL